jgi:hypothetical protein
VVLHWSIERNLVAAFNYVKGAVPYLINMPIWDK